LSFLPEQLIHRSQQLVRMDTKRGFLGPATWRWRLEIFKGISAATATIGHGVPLWAGLRQYLLRLIYDWFLVSGLDVTGVTGHEKIYDLSHRLK